MSKAELITWAKRGMKHNRVSKNYREALSDLIIKLNTLPTPPQTKTI